MKYDVFISYSRTDTAIADMIVQALDDANISYFIDRKNIGGGMEFPEVLAQAIKGCKVLLFLASRNSYMSAFTMNEITYAFNKKKHILPFIIDSSELPDTLEFVCSSKNWRRISQHPIIPTLINDILALLDNEVNKPANVMNEESNSSVVNGGVQTTVSKKHREENISIEKIGTPYSGVIEDARQAMSQFKMDDAFDLLLRPSLENNKEAQMLMASLVDNFEDIYNVPIYYFDEAKEAANSGNSFAQFIMANYYRVKEINLSEIFRYAQMSTDKGDANGMFTLSRCYEYGFGTEINFTKSKELLRQSIRIGSTSALLYHASNCLYAWTIKHDVEKGIKLLKQCMELRIPESFDVIGKLYSEGKYIEKDNEKAEKFFCQAIAEGYPQAYGDLGMLYTQPSTDDFDKNRQKGIEILQKGAEFGIPSCLGALAIIYDNFNENNVDIPRDKEKALLWYKRASERGHKPSMIKLGYNYYYGRGVNTDVNVAWEWFKKSECLYMLGKMCLDGNGRDGEKEYDCISYFKESASRGGLEGANSARTLYELYRDKRMEDSELFQYLKKYRWNEIVITCIQRCNELDYPWIEKDNEKAMIYIKRAAEIDINDGDILRYGLLLTEINSPFFNEIEGAKYLRKASKRGLSIADVRLGDLYKDGILVADDALTAKRYYQKAAEVELPLGKARYGILLANEILNSTKDIQIGNEEYSIYKQAFNMLSSAYHFGETSVVESVYLLGKEQKYAYAAAIGEARHILNQAAQRQHFQGLIYSGMMYQYGDLQMSVDKRKALEYYKQAVSYDSAAAHYIVQLLYTENANDATSDELATTFYWGRYSDDKKDQSRLYKLNRIGKDIVSQCENGKRNKEDAIKWVFPWMCDEWIMQDSWRYSLDGLQWADYSNNRQPNDNEKDMMYFPTELCDFVKDVENLKKKLADTHLDVKLGNPLPQFEAKDCFPVLSARIMDKTARACFDIWLYVLNEELTKYLDESELYTLMNANSDKMLNRNIIKDNDICMLVHYIINIKNELDKLASSYCHLYNLPMLTGDIFDCDVQTDYIRKVADIFFTGNDSIPRCYQLAAKLYARDPDCQLSYVRLKHCKEIIGK